MFEYKEDKKYLDDILVRLKNINYEMEKASQEFSKLFNYDVKDK